MPSHTVADRMPVLRVRAGHAGGGQSDVGRARRRAASRTRTPSAICRATSGSIGLRSASSCGVDAEQARLELGGVGDDSPAHHGRRARHAHQLGRPRSPPVSDSATAIVIPRRVSSSMTRAASSARTATAAAATLRSARYSGSSMTLARPAFQACQRYSMPVNTVSTRAAHDQHPLTQLIQCPTSSRAGRARTRWPRPARPS